MGLYKLYSCNVETQYKSCLFSKATLFTICINIFNVVLPLIMAYRTKGFWLKHYNFYEQPSVSFKYEYFFIAETNDLDFEISCGDVPEPLNQYLHNAQHCYKTSIEEIDPNHDGRTDKIRFNINVHLPSQKNIINVLLILSLDVVFETVCPLVMQSGAVIQSNFPYPSAKLDFTGDLQLNQKKALPCISRHLDTYYNHTLFENWDEGSEDKVVNSILESYYSRHVFTEVKELYSRMQFGSSEEFLFTATLNIPELSVRYTPHVWQELKWAWHQYLSLFVIFYFLFGKLKEYVFTNRLVMAWKIKT